MIYHKHITAMLNFAYCSDKYQYTMGKSFYDSGMKDQHAVFNMFYRKAPENNNWAVVSGTDEVIEMIEWYNRSSARRWPPIGLARLPGHLPPS